MLDNIKLLLNITNTTQDNLINLLINKATISVLSYCNRSTLNPSLENFIENKIVVILKDVFSLQNSVASSTGSGSTTIDAPIKSITRGDTKMEYAVTDAESNKGSSTLNILDALNLTEQDKMYLNRYRKLRFPK